MHFAEKVPTIYFATYEGRIKAQLLNEPGKISTIVDNRDSARGIAYDPTGDRIYWSTINGYKILRATVDGKEVQTVFHDNKCKSWLLFMSNPFCSNDFQVANLSYQSLQTSPFSALLPTGSLEISTWGLKQVILWCVTRPGTRTSVVFKFLR